MRRAAYAIFAAACCAALGATPARADVTYTWETLSANGPATGFYLTFTVSGDVSVNADDSFAGLTAVNQGPNPQVTYQFPLQITSFEVEGAGGALTLSDFKSPLNAGQALRLGDNEVEEPMWTFDLTADVAAQTASLSLYFFGDQTYIGAVGGDQRGPPDLFSTDQITTISIISDQAGQSGTFTGKLVASATVPEPRSLWVLMAGVGMLWLVSRAGARQSKT